MICAIMLSLHVSVLLLCLLVTSYLTLKVTFSFNLLWFYFLLLFLCLLCNYLLCPH